MLTSIVIPSKDPNQFLLQNVEMIMTHIQKVNSQMELIVVDDSLKGNESLFKKFVHLENFKRIHSGGRGSAFARNTGIKEARGAVIIFYDDDIEINISSINDHVGFHKKRSELTVALVGTADISKKIIKSSPITQWVEENKLQFADLQSEPEVNYRHFYTCNLSVKRRYIIENGGFNNLFRSAVYDDLELGYRLEKKGLRLFFHKENQVSHYKRFTLESLIHRYFLMGKYAVVFMRLHPELENKFISLRPRLSEQLLILVQPFLKLFYANDRQVVNNGSGLYLKATVTKSFFSGIHQND